MTGPPEGCLAVRVQVMVRVRPPLPGELGAGARFTPCLGLGPPTPQGHTLYVSGAPGGPRSYTFDQVVPLQAGQEEVYGAVMPTAAASLLQGYNVTLLAFGQSRSGKSHTLVGREGAMEGLLPRLVRGLVAGGAELAMAMVGIHQEVATDLLDPSMSLVGVSGATGGVTVDGLSEVEVDGVEEVMSMVQEGLTRRAEGGMSHVVVRLVVRLGEREARMHMVEVAGSECLTTGTEAEEVAVGSSLFSLLAMAEGLSSSKGFVPYR